jgi:hypothetical protein
MLEQTGIIMQTPSQFMRLFRKWVSLRNYLETCFLVININFCYGNLERLGIVCMK